MTALDGNFAGARYDPNTEEHELPHLLFTAGQMQTTRCSAGRLPSHSRDALRTRQASGFEEDSRVEECGYRIR